MDNWYGIVDGDVPREANIDLMGDKSSKKSFKWNVNILHCRYPAERYRQLSQVSNMRQSLCIYVEYTLTDVLSNLLYEYERPSILQRRVMERKMALAFDGNIILNASFLSQIASTTMRLTSELTLVIVKIASRDQKKFYLQSERLN